MRKQKRQMIEEGKGAGEWKRKQNYLADRIHSLPLSFRLFLTVSKFYFCQEALSSLEGLYITASQKERGKQFKEIPIQKAV